MPCTDLSPTRARKKSATVSPEASSSVYSKSSNTERIASRTPAVASRPSNGRKATGLWNCTSGASVAIIASRSRASAAARNGWAMGERPTPAVCHPAALRVDGPRGARQGSRSPGARSRAARGAVAARGRAHPRAREDWERKEEDPAVPGAQPDPEEETRRGRRDRDATASPISCPRRPERAGAGRRRRTSRATAGGRARRPGRGGHRHRQPGRRRLGRAGRGATSSRHPARTLGGVRDALSGTRSRPGSPRCSRWACCCSCSTRRRCRAPRASHVDRRAACALMLLTAWATVALTGRDGMTDLEFERLVRRSEELARPARPASGHGRVRPARGRGDRRAARGLPAAARPDAGRRVAAGRRAPRLRPLLRRHRGARQLPGPHRRLPGHARAGLRTRPRRSCATRWSGPSATSWRTTWAGASAGFAELGL